MSDYVACTPEDFYALAAKIRQLEESEIGYRAVCNRAYYACYQAAKVFHANLPSPGSVGSAKGSHEQLIAQLDSPTIARDRTYWISKGIAKTLRITYQHRVSADYIHTQPIQANHADESLVTSAQIIAQFRAAAPN